MTKHLLDPLNVNDRLYRQLALMLDVMEAEHTGMTIRERIAALIAIGRIQTMFMGLRKENNEPDGYGSAVRKYSRTFASNAARRRAPGGGTSAVDAAVADAVGSDDDGDDSA